MDALFELCSLLLKLNDFRCESSMLNGLFQQIVVGYEDSKLRLIDLGCPLLDLIGMVSTVVVVEVFKSES